MDAADRSQPPRAGDGLGVAAYRIALPTVAFALGLKLTRVLSIADEHSVFSAAGVLQLLLSDLCMGAVLWLLSSLLLRVSARAGRLALGAACAQGLSCLVMGLDLVAHTYFMETGSGLAWPMLAYWVAHPLQLLDSMKTVAHPGAWPVVGLALAVAMVIVSPYLPGGVRPHAASRPLRTRRLAIELTLVCLLVAVGIWPRATRVEPGFVLDPVLRLGLGAVRLGLLSEKPRPQLALPPLALVRAKPRLPPTNVAIVVLESTRAESLSLYDPSLPTTPFLAELARTATVAERAYAVVPHTSKALMAILCGVTPPLTVRHLGSRPGVMGGRCLPSILRSAGYASAFFQAAIADFEDRVQQISASGFEDFFPVDSMDTAGFHRANWLGYEDQVMLKPSRRWLLQHHDAPFVAAYLTLATHGDYYAPADRSLPLARDPTMNRYLNALRYQDEFLEKLIGQYKSLGLYERTLFVIVGDHGEGFGEHGRRYHDDDVYEEGLRVPLVIVDGTGRAPRSSKVSAPVNQLDILPTVLDALGYEGRGGMTGSSLLHPIPSRVLYGACYNERRCMVRIDASLKLIHYGTNGWDEVYDLARDPLEQHDLVSEYASSLPSWRNDVFAWSENVADMWFIRRSVASRARAP